MDKLIVSNAPHIHTSDSSRRVMLDVVIALLPATVAAVVIFGTGALKVIAACVIGAAVSEALFDLATHRKQTVGDFSAVVTGLLLGLNLSSSVPVWQCVVGSAFAIIIVKCLFGGLGTTSQTPPSAAVCSCCLPSPKSQAALCRLLWSLRPPLPRWSSSLPVPSSSPR